MKWTAPCGHSNGVPVIGSFVLCSVPHCDGTPGARCHKCPSKRIAPFSGPFVPPDATHCLDCGAVRFAGY